MSNKYVTLAQKNGAQLSKRFRVISEAYEPALEKDTSFNKTIGGSIDASVGAIFEVHSYVFRLAHTEGDSDYGTLGDITTLYRLNNPDPTASDYCVLTLTDHYGSSHNVMFAGRLVPKPLTTTISGIYAHFMIPVVLQFMQ